MLSGTKATGNTAVVTNWDDYYPFGSIAQSGTTGSTYRYDYQGLYAQKDNITNWNDFELRMYDGKVGGWLSMDPKGIGFSPYVGMGNNPVSLNDPDGGDPWHPDDNGNLVADPGDNAVTLSDYLKISLSSAQSLFGTAGNWDNGTDKLGLTDITGHYLTANDAIGKGFITVLSQVMYVNKTPDEVQGWSPSGVTGAFYNLNHNWGIGGRILYGTLDQFVVTGTRMVGIGGDESDPGDGRHLDGSAATKKELLNAGVGTVSSFIPFGEIEGSMAGEAKVLSASEFSTKYAGEISAGKPGVVNAYNFHVTNNLESIITSAGVIQLTSLSYSIYTAH